MPFVQRVVQPTRLAQVAPTTNRTKKFQCVPGKCKNINCINKIQSQENGKEEVEEEAIAVIQQVSLNDKEDSVFNSRGKVQGKTECNGRLLLERQSTTRVKDTEEQYDVQQTRIATKAIVHNSEIIVSQTQTSSSHAIVSVVNGFGEQGGELRTVALQVNDAEMTVTNGCSFSYATDNEDDLCHSVAQQRATKPQTLSPLKKLKQHVEFMPPTSPTHTTTKYQQQHLQNQPRNVSYSTTKTATTTTTTSTTTTTKTKAKLVTGYEFESISNITLSNALRQLASLVLLASDIFDDLQRELQSVGERTRNVQQKIVAVEQRVTAYDPKLVAVRKCCILLIITYKIAFSIDYYICIYSVVQPHLNFVIISRKSENSIQ